MKNLTLPEGISLVHVGDQKELPALRIVTPLCQAVIAQQGAQVLSFQASGKKPLLWLSENAVFSPGKAIRGGIPLCFPWFGPHPGDAGKPAHGFARLREWELVAATRQGDACELRFRLQDDAATRALWPHAFAAILTITLAETLILSLTVENTGSQTFPLSLAFHSYFPVTRIQHLHLRGLEDTAFIDQLNQCNTVQAAQSPVRFSGETDRIYTQAGGHYHLLDEDSGHRIDITATHCHSAIVWNPWQEKTLRLDDMPADAWQKMVCVECGNVGSDTLSLAPGESRRFMLHLQNRQAPGGILIQDSSLRRAVESGK